MRLSYLKGILALVAGVSLIACLPKQTESGTSSQPEMHTVEGPSYENLSGCKKEAILLAYMNDTVYKDFPAWTGREALGIMAFLWPREAAGRVFMNVSMERSSDVMPDGRKKLVHTYGSTAAVRLVADPQNPFSGVLAGAECALVRASAGVPPSKTNLTPGIALKFLLDGRPSVNVMALYSLDGQQSFNFFLNELSNFLAEPSSFALKLGQKVFGLASIDPLKVSSGHLARVKPNGEPVRGASIDSPEQLYFVPYKEDLSFSDAVHDFREDLRTIPEGTKLFEVFGRRKGETQRIRIGHLELKTKFVASEFSDKRLFFKHKRIESTETELETE